MSIISVYSKFYPIHIFFNYLKRQGEFFLIPLFFSKELNSKISPLTLLLENKFTIISVYYETE